MRHRPASALAAAALCIGGLVLTAVLALIVPIAQQHDSATLYGFTTLSEHTRVSRLATDVAHLVDPSRYLIAAAAFVTVALLRGRTRVALAVPLTMFAASATTELLKSLSPSRATPTGSDRAPRSGPGRGRAATPPPR